MQLIAYCLLRPNLAEVALQTPGTVSSEVASLQGRHRLQIGRGSALFCASLSAKNRMVQAPKSWYNRYKSYGAPGQKTCAKTLPFREIVPAKYVTWFHIIPVPQARRHYMILYLYTPRRNHTILYLHTARHFLAKTIRFCTFTNSLPPVDFLPEMTYLPDEYHAFSKLKK